MLDVQLFGLTAGPAHMVNVVFHVFNTLLLFGWSLRATKQTWRSAFVAAVFAVHPLHVESVSWIAERKDVLSGFFWLVTLWTYSFYSANRNWRRYSLLLLAFTCGLMSKPSVVTLPLVLLLVDLWPLKNRGAAHGWSRWAPLLLEKTPLVLLAAVTSAVTVLVQTKVGAVSDLTALSTYARLNHAIVGYAIYLWKFLVPLHLAVFYPLRDWPMTTAVAAAALFVGLSAASFAARARRPYLFVGWSWFVIALVPMIGLVQAGSQAVADRFMYLPMIGLLFAVAWGVPDLASRLSPPQKSLMAAAGLVTLALFAVESRALAASWFDDATLWRHAVENTSGNYLAEVNLGSALARRGDASASIPEYRAALTAIGDKWPEQRAAIHADLGFAMIQLGDFSGALDEFDSSVRLNPVLPQGHAGAGEALSRLGRFQESIGQFRSALQADPAYYDALTGLGGAFLGLGDATSAIPYYRRATDIRPSDVDAHDSLGSALAMAGQKEDAATEFQTAIRLAPQMPAPHTNFGLLLLTEGRIEEARREIGAALEVDPSFPRARRLWASLPPKAGK